MYFYYKPWILETPRKLVPTRRHNCERNKVLDSFESLHDDMCVLLQQYSEKSSAL